MNQSTQSAQSDKLIKMTNPNGLILYNLAMTDDLHDEILEFLNDSNENWKHVIPNNKNSRKVMHFGYEYNYLTKNTDTKTTEMPKIIKKVRRLLADKVENYKIFNQCIVNKYLAGQGISKHIDRKEFGDTICCFTIGSGATMKFTLTNHDDFNLYVRPKSLYIMTKESRYKWTHEMEYKKKDIVDGQEIIRSTRYSITFRIVPTKINIEK